MAVSESNQTTADGAQNLSDRIEDYLLGVPEENKTPDRDDAAREILQWQARGEWPLTGPEMSERGEFSPQHYRNTIAWYSLEDNGFHTQDDVEHDEDGSGSHVRGSGLSIDVPEDLDGKGEVQAYVRGWLDNLDRE